jgi:hypothetical protein
MQATAATIWFTKLERLEAERSRLEAQIEHHKTSVRYSRQGQVYRPLVPICGHREGEIATAAAARATAARGGRHVSFEEALAALRSGK